MATLLVRGLHVCQAAIAAWGLLHSYQAIIKLQKYETTTKKLAEWSNEAGHQLQRTRTTQGAGAVAVLLSFLTATALATSGGRFSSWLKYGASPVMLVATLLARRHIQNFWTRDGRSTGIKVKMPKMEAYVEGKIHTEDVLQALEYLQYSWIATSTLAAVFGY